MGTILTNNVYLPDEGERNCYSGLAANWQILDDAVGTIAGKAAASHTHGNIQNDGTLSAASKVVITDNTQKITTSSITATELDYLSGVTSNIQSQIDTKANSSSLATVATSGSYNDLSNTPTIPTVNDATLTIQKNGTNISRFTANSATDTTVNITVPTKTSELSNDSGYITGVAWDDVTNKPSTYTPSSHTHGNITNTGAIGSTAGLPIITGTDGILTTGSFGTTSGTICEGNDSRLSDARTPVAHTHTKSDITDLFNSANTWSGEQTYTANTIFSNFITSKESSAISAGSYGKGITFRDYQNNRLGYIQPYVTSNNETRILLGVDSGNIASNSNLIPNANNAVNLGSSSYQWGNLYAKNYFYNGTQWGLDQNQEWTNYNKFRAYRLQVKATNQEIGVIPSSYVWNGFQFVDKNDIRTFSIEEAFSSTETRVAFTLVDNLNSTPSAIEYKELLRFTLTSSDQTAYVKTNVTPISHNTYNLGTSSNKWKNLWANGINSIPTDTVEWHNSHYRGENLVSSGHFANMAALLTAIRNQDWSDIYIGDYVELTFTYEEASRTVKFYVGEIDKFYKVGNSSLTTHHLVMITGDLGINQVMNDTNTTAGGYVGSKAHTTTLPALYEIINPLFNNAILTHREHLSNTVTSTQSVSLTLNDTAYTCSNFPIFSSGDPNATGIVTAGAWYDCNLVLMSEIEMFGSNRFSSSGIDDIMTPEGQIAVFKYNRDLLTLGRTVNTWLRNVNSASRFCACGSRGNSGRNGATTTGIRLRPRFLIG